MLIPWHSHSTRENMYSRYNIVLCGYSVCFEARLPLDKIDKCLSLIASFLTCKNVTLKEIQSLTGMLNFACSVVVPSRAFLHRLIDLTVGVHSPHHYIRINNEVKANLALAVFSDWLQWHVLLSQGFLGQFRQVRAIHWCRRFIRFWGSFWQKMVVWEMAA